LVASGLDRFSSNISVNDIAIGFFSQLDGRASAKLEGRSARHRKDSWIQRRGHQEDRSDHTLLSKRQFKSHL
jgi:hypothetical protein